MANKTDENNGKMTDCLMAMLLWVEVHCTVYMTVLNRDALSRS